MITISLTSWIVNCLLIFVLLTYLGVTELFEWKNNDVFDRSITVVYLASALLYLLRIIYDIMIFT